MSASTRAAQALCLGSCCLLLCLGASRGTRQLLQSQPPGSSVSQELTLLEFAQGLTNFQTVAQSNHFNGWGQNSSQACGGANQTVTSTVSECDPDNQVYRSADRNAWTGVTCNPTGSIVCIHLAGFGLQGSASALEALQDLPSLAYLHLGNNYLKGTLPEDLGSVLSSLQILYLDDNALNSSLPSEWGSAWPDLQWLYLQGNTLYSTLPAAWGYEGTWNSLQQLNLSSNQLQGSIPASWGANYSGWPALQEAYLQPGNQFCGDVPEGFPAVRATGEYVTGPTYDLIVSFNTSCSSESSAVASSDSSGDDLSQGAVAGIITGEVLLGTFLLLFSGTIHRRYRWRQERSWVLFDWDVVADPPPAKQRRSAFHFGWGSKHSQSSGAGGDAAGSLLPNGSLTKSPPKASTGVVEMADLAAQQPAGGGGDQRRSGSLGNLPDMIWQDSLMAPEDVVIQQHPDGSLRQLGNGSFGKVYKGVLQEVHEVAVKVFEGYVGQREQELLLKEITILRSCRNKNIVQFFGVTFRDSDIWMVMELMEGNLFRHLARGHHCTWYFRGRSIALDIARGMHFLHGRRIIHMDLKSPNILLGSNGEAKIADVGLARVMGSESIANQVVAGTMHWMAPEVLIHGRCTEKADIFSFGVILWEICTAEAPTRGRMSTVNVPDECPEEVAQLIDACMLEDPEQRPSALDIIQAITAIPVTQRPQPQRPWYAR